MHIKLLDKCIPGTAVPGKFTKYILYILFKMLTRLQNPRTDLFFQPIVYKTNFVQDRRTVPLSDLRRENRPPV